MSKKIDLSNLRHSSVSKFDIVLSALNTIEKRNGPFKERWLQATRKAGAVFTSTDTMLQASLAHAMRPTDMGGYNTTATSCGCEAAYYGAPCYHRAYVLLGIRYAEANGGNREIDHIPF